MGIISYPYNVIRLTQNQNKSIKSIVWSFCLKLLFCQAWKRKFFKMPETSSNVVKLHCECKQQWVSGKLKSSLTKNM